MTKDFRGKLLFPSRGPNPLLRAGSQSTFTCPFRESFQNMGFGASALDDPSEAQIAVVTEYAKPRWWPKFWFSDQEERSAFFLNTKTVPPRWVPGVLN